MTKLNKSEYIMINLVRILVFLYITIPCMANPNCTAKIPGDLDDNCKVDFMDFSIMSSDWQQSSTCEPNVTEEWVARYDGPGGYYDRGRRITTDNIGNIYVTGYSWGAGTNYDYLTIKYDPNGDQLWEARYNGTANNEDKTLGIVVDALGNVYVTGYSSELHADSMDQDYTTIKYDSNGTVVWVAKYNGPDDVYDSAYDIAVDEHGNVFVTGQSQGDNYRYDYVTIKYDPNGNQLWEARYDGPGNYNDCAYAIAIDSIGNAYVTGYSEGVSTNEDFATVKYDPNGNEQWVARYNGSANGDDNAHDIRIDNSNNIYVAGFSRSSNYDYTTIKYDSDGNQIWLRTYNGPGNSSDYAQAIVIDDLNNVYITGYSWGGSTKYDYATVKYNSAGNQEWIVRYNGTGNSYDYGAAISVDGESIYVSGYSWGNGTGYDYAVVKYDLNGNHIWTARYNGPDNNKDWVSWNSIGVDIWGNVVVTGESYLSGSDSCYATVKYNTNGDGMLPKNCTT